MKDRATSIKAKFPQNSLANVTNAALQATLLEDVGKNSGALTATSDGTGAGQVPGPGYYVVTSADANYIVLLPPLAAVAPGDVVMLEATATAFELRASGTEKLNDKAAPLEAAIPATGLAVCIATTAGWLLTYYTELGAVATAIVPD